MTLKNSQECACRLLDEYRSDTSRMKRPLVILTDTNDLADVRKIVGGSMPLGSECHGAGWKDSSGRSISVRKYSDPVPDFQGDFILAVCNGGQPYSERDRKDMKRWRKAAKDIV